MLYGSFRVLYNPESIQHNFSILKSLKGAIFESVTKPIIPEMKLKLQQLAQQLDGDLFDDSTMRTLYATDASAYREMPLAVAIPKTTNDIKKLIAFARSEKTSLVPRTAGTSLAGQVVGNGIIVDVSKHFTRIIDLNTEERWVRVQPGVIRDELNMFLKPHGLFLAPKLLLLTGR